MDLRTAVLVFTLVVPGACRETAPPSGTENGNGNGNGNGDGTTADILVRVDTLQRFQTMTGWEAVAQAGHENPDYPQWQNELLDKAVNELGLNRLRLPVKAGSENRTDFYQRALNGESANPRCERYETANDNDSPVVINPAGFHFSEMDTAIVKIVLPMKQRMEARGEKLFVNLNYTAFLLQCGPNISYVHGNAEEYAEFILAAFLHMKGRYGFVPDAVEIILEPDNVQPFWNSRKLGEAILATSTLLSLKGFQPVFIAPSTTSMSNAVTWTRDMFRITGVSSLVSEISYHRYGGVSDENLRALAELAETHNSKTAMLEHIGSDVEALYADLTLGRASGWQQFTIAFGPGDGGGQYYRIVDNRPVMGARTRYLRQYFRYVRMGARRVAATSTHADLRPVAFQNQNRGIVVVMHTRGSGTIEIRGLSPGTYGASITTSTLTGSDLGDQTAGSRGSVIVTSPGEGVLTLYRK